MLVLLSFLLHTAAAAVPVGEYDAVRAALAIDDLPAAQAAGRVLASDSTLDPALLVPAQGVAAATDLPGMRTAFAALSRATILALGEKPAEKVFAYHCPMYAGFGYWLQSKAGLANPYFGQSMATCGEGVSMKAAVKAANGGAK